MGAGFPLHSRSKLLDLVNINCRAVRKISKMLNTYRKTGGYEAYVQTSHETITSKKADALQCVEEHNILERLVDDTSFEFCETSSKNLQNVWNDIYALQHNSRASKTTLGASGIGALLGGNLNDATLFQKLTLTAEQIENARLR